jgi:hypothetical protein
MVTLASSISFVKWIVRFLVKCYFDEQYEED